MKKIFLLLLCLCNYFIMAQQTVINYNHLTRYKYNSTNETSEVISSNYIDTILKWEESSNDFTIIKTGGTNYLLLHDKQFIREESTNNGTRNIFKFKDNQNNDVFIVMMNDYSSFFMKIGSERLVYENK